MAVCSAIASGCKRSYLYTGLYIGVVTAYSKTLPTPAAPHCNLNVGYASTLLLGGLMRQVRLLYWERSWIAVFAGGSRFEPRYQLSLCDL